MSYPNHEQKSVLDHLYGTLLVLAPAGTGKTRIMADRLAAVIANGMPAEKTLGVTFTNRAAEHMRKAVRVSCGASAKECRIQTFHGLCAWMLRMEARDLGLPADFVIYDEQDSIDLLRQCLSGTDISPDSAFWQLSQMKSDCPNGSLILSQIPQLDTSRLAEPLRKAIRIYHEHLAERNALDFSDLLYRTRAMLATLPEKRRKWSGRFQWIQMDEVQDTHVSEYEVIRLLASQATGIAFFGDLDQTIYEWRGSNPDEVINRVKADFGPVTELPLRDNYRATKALLRVADRHAATLAHRRTRTQPAATLLEGATPECHHAGDSSSEADWIASRLKRMLTGGDPGRIGILTRTHKRSQAVSTALAYHGIPHLTVEEFDFFRRQEIKDLLARLRLLQNSADSGALQRLILRPACGIGPATLRSIWSDGQPCGLRLTDLAQLRSHQHGEPYQTLLNALAHGTVVVFDVETTGLSPAVDEVIDLGAVKLVGGRPAERFEALLRPSRPLGASASVHGISEETLQTHGRDPAEVFHEFARFAEGAVLVGHNISFDLSMIHAHATRLGIALPTLPWDDTLDLARRFLDLERHDLTTVSRHLDTPNRPSHRALSDALATADVLMRLRPQLAAGAPDRQKLIARHGRSFLPIAEKLTAWHNLSNTLRPAELAQRVLDESGLLDSYEETPTIGSGGEGFPRAANLKRFIQFFHQHDDPARPPADMLGELTHRIALARNLDFLADDDHSIPILTVHQSKGLEFDTVFVAGLTEDEFPSYYSKQDLKLEEEKRLFYVAITRAKRHLILSSYQTNDWGRTKPPSSFLKGLI
jgi:DNA helicase-2/ATP-dependent DNA helicase PcrA